MQQMVILHLMYCLQTILRILRHRGIDNSAMVMLTDQNPIHTYDSVIGNNHTLFKQIIVQQTMADPTGKIRPIISQHGHLLRISLRM